jgi:hypothetical protein
VEVFCSTAEREFSDSGDPTIVYVLTILVTFHGVTTKFDLDPRLTKWADAPRCAAIGELLREDLGDADHVVTFRCDRQEDL